MWLIPAHSQVPAGGILATHCNIRFCPGKVTQIVSEWGEIFVLTADRKMQQLTEKDVQTKLEMLYKKVQLALVVC